MSESEYTCPQYPWSFDPSLDTPESFPFFVVYRDGKYSRNLNRVRISAWVPGGVRREATLAEVTRWYVSAKWQARSAAYDAHMDAIFQQERDALARDDAKEMARRHREILSLKTHVVSSEWHKRASMAEMSDTDPTMTIRELDSATSSLIKDERLVTGQSTEKIETFSALTDEELDLYIELERKKTGK